jgi:hypothetical protein
MEVHKNEYKNVIVTIFMFLTGTVCTRSGRDTKTNKLVLHIICGDWHCHWAWNVSPGTEN